MGCGVWMGKRGKRSKGTEAFSEKEPPSVISALRHFRPPSFPPSVISALRHSRPLSFPRRRESRKAYDGYHFPGVRGKSSQAQPMKSILIQRYARPATLISINPICPSRRFPIDPPPMALHLCPSQLQQIHRHAEETYPEECCGLLLGTLQSNPKTWIVSEVWSVQNAWTEELAESYNLPQASIVDPHSRRDRYWIDPQDLLNAQRYGRDRQVNLIGVYHSHPDHPARPSECDRQLAWTGYIYLIASLQNGHVCDTSSWALDDHHRFQPAPIIIQDGMELMGRSPTLI